MDPEEQGQDSEIQVEENSPSEEQLPADDAPQHEGGYNPAFEPIRQKLGLQFETIKDDLLEVEKGFNSGITKANSKYAPWKALEDQGLTPDSINQGFGLLRQLNDEPEKIYTALHDFLKQNGRLPQTDAEVQEVIDDAEDDDPEDRLSKLFEEREAQLAQQMEHHVGLRERRSRGNHRAIHAENAIGLYPGIHGDAGQLGCKPPCRGCLAAREDAGGLQQEDGGA